MKKIINGKKYDTETAKKLGVYSNGGSWRDFNHYVEELYQKKTGEFFLFGEGGPMTQYAQQIEQNTRSGGKAIIPMTYTEAAEWAEENLEADEYESIFGEVAEDDSKQIVTLYLTRGLVERMKREAQETGTGLSALVESKLG